VDQKILDQAAAQIDATTEALKPRTEIAADDRTLPCSMMRVAAIQRAVEACGDSPDATLLGVVVTYVLHQPKTGPLMRMSGDEIIDAACDMADALPLDEITAMSEHALKRWEAYAVAQKINNNADDKGGPEGNLPSSDG